MYHRRITFAASAPKAASFVEWARFITANGIANTANLLVYSLLVIQMQWQVLWALAVASLLAAILSYVAAAKWVFR